MCGITGFFSNYQIPREYFAAHALISHRGPDDEGFVAGNKCGCKEPFRLCGDKTKGKWRNSEYFNDFHGSYNWILGHHRLSILDLSDRGHQPFSDKTGRFWLVINGEIYNYKELRTELEQFGYIFHSETDSEVALNSYIHWGLDCFNRFNGMWAFALFDTLNKELILCRDRFGIKPLYYHFGEKDFLLASEAKFFKPLLNLTVNNELAAEYISTCHLDHKAETLYREIFQIPPAHYAIYDYSNHTLQFHKYWSIDDVLVDKTLDYRSTVAKFGELFNSSIDLRMRSDVSVGCLLSGGLDSTSIVSNIFSRGLFPECGFHSFTAAFHEEAYSEKSYVDDTGVRCKGLIGHFVYPDPKNLPDTIGNLLYMLDFPVRSLAVYSQSLLYKLVRDSSPVVVLLNGQGGDELFGGYTAHYYSLILSYMLQGDIRRALAEARKYTGIRNEDTVTLAKNLTWQFLIHFFNAYLKIKRPSANPYFKKRLFLDPVSFHRDPFENALRSNLCFSALPEYLRYEDRNSMASSLESRLPFLDYRIVELAYTIPHEFKISEGVNKKIVRDTVSSYTTPSVVGRRDKMGFISPQELWQKTELRDLMTEVIRASWDVPFLDRRKLLRGFQNYLDGLDSNWPFWWRVFCYIYWLEVVCEK